MSVSGRHRLRRGIVAALCHLVLALAALIALFPLFWTVSTAVKQRADTFAMPPRFFDFTPTLQNFEALLAAPRFATIYLNTLVIMSGATFLCVTVSTLAAYALARSPGFRGRTGLEVGLILTRAVPTVVLIVPLFQIVSRLGLYDDHLTLIVMYAAINVPFATWLLTAFFQQIPPALEEAAAMDGASRLRILWFVVLPLAAPGIGATTIFVALLTWNEFLIPVMLAGRDAQTLPVFIAGYISARNLDWGPMAAASTLAILPIAVVTVLAQRVLVSGLGTGAVKG